MNRETRRCTVYEARPEICRAYPGNSRCGYYDFLAFERRAQEDAEFIPSTFNGPKD
jgi:Fe-S-cluster containining protein